MITSNVLLMNSRFWALFEKAFVVLALLLFSHALIPLFLQESGLVDVSLGEGNIATKIMWSVVYLFTTLFIVMRWKRFIRVVITERFVWLLIGIALISVFWSDFPMLTLRRCIALIGTTLFGVYLAVRFDSRELLRLLAWTMGTAAFLSFVFALALPNYGVARAYSADEWRGVYLHKQILGRTMSLSTLVFFLLGKNERNYRWIARVGFAMSGALILLSTSRTSMVVTPFLLIILPIYGILRWRKYTLMGACLILAAFIGLVVASWIFMNLEMVLTILGRDITLTGRLLLWISVFEKILSRPFIGYGFSGFWVSWESEAADVWIDIEPFIGSVVMTAHNGFLDLWLQLGLLGLLVFAILFLKSFLRALRWVRFTKTADGLWPVAYMTFMFLTNMVQSFFFGPNNIYWVLFVATVFLMHPIHKSSLSNAR